MGVAHPRAIDRATAGRSLSPDQERVVRALCRDRVGVAVLRAPAGTGKTFVMDAAREAWEASGVGVLGRAVSARAALELHDQAGIDAITIARLHHALDRGRELPHRGVLVIDEAGMVGTRDLAHLAKAADRAEAKLVLVGDDRQLPEIHAGGAFRALADRLGANVLREVRRQREAWDRQALDALRNGEVERWARAYRDRGHITIANSAPAARAALVNDWHRAQGDRLMIAARRDDVADLNQRARELLQAEGTVGPDELETAGRRFAKGDRVTGRHNDRTVGILNGQRGTIQHIDADRRSLDVQLETGKQITVPNSYLQPGHLDHGYAITAHRAQGATVDRTFILGSDELYREWGYTALSRHRDEARFYISRGDLGPEHDLRPSTIPSSQESSSCSLAARPRISPFTTSPRPTAPTSKPRRTRCERDSPMTPHRGPRATASPTSSNAQPRGSKPPASDANASKTSASASAGSTVAGGMSWTASSTSTPARSSKPSNAGTSPAWGTSRPTASNATGSTTTARTPNGSSASTSSLGSVTAQTGTSSASSTVLRTRTIRSSASLMTSAWILDCEERHDQRDVRTHDERPAAYR